MEYPPEYDEVHAVDITAALPTPLAWPESIDSVWWTENNEVQYLLKEDAVRGGCFDPVYRSLGEVPELPDDYYISDEEVGSLVANWAYNKLVPMLEHQP